MLFKGGLVCKTRSARPPRAFIRMQSMFRDPAWRIFVFLSWNTQIALPVIWHNARRKHVKHDGRIFYIFGSFSDYVLAFWKLLLSIKAFWKNLRWFEYRQPATFYFISLYISISVLRVCWSYRYPPKISWLKTMMVLPRLFRNCNRLWLKSCCLP